MVVIFFSFFGPFIISKKAFQLSNGDSLPPLLVGVTNGAVVVVRFTIKVAVCARVVAVVVEKEVVLVVVAEVEVVVETIALVVEIGFAIVLVAV